MQTLSTNNPPPLAARTKVYRKAERLSTSGEPPEWQIVLHERYKPDAPIRRYAGHQETEQDDDPEVRPALFALDVRERERPDDAHRRREDADEDEPGRRHVYRNLAEQNRCTGERRKPCLGPRSIKKG